MTAPAQAHASAATRRVGFASVGPLPRVGVARPRESSKPRMDAARTITMGEAPFLLETASIASLQRGGWLDILGPAVAAGDFTERQEATALRVLANRLAPARTEHQDAFERRIRARIESNLMRIGERVELRKVFGRRTERMVARGLIAADDRFAIISRSPIVVERIS